MKTIDLQTWKRKEHFAYFSSLDDPYWCVTVEVDCTVALQEARENSLSFFLLYLHCALLAANKVEEFGYRIVDGQVVCYDEVHASVTVLREDETFGCCFIGFKPDFSEFSAAAAEQISFVKARSGMCIEKDYLLNQIHISTLPWMKFTGLTYAKSLKPQDSVPKITFGRYFAQGDRFIMPLAIQVHHALIDGLPVAKFFDAFQTLLNQRQC